MTTRLYYLMSFLPPLPPLGESPPITPAELFRIIEEEKPRDVRLLAQTFSFESQLIRAAHIRLLEHSWGDTPGAFSLDPEAPPYLLDLFFKDPQEMGEDAWLTELWSKHFDFLESIGENIDSPLLCRWAQWERALRQQLVAIRQQSETQAEASSAARQWDHSELIATWRAAPDPMAGEKLLDEARVRFIEEESRRYSFGVDELVAYFLKLGLLSRYARLNREDGIRTLEEVTAL